MQVNGVHKQLVEIANARRHYARMRENYVIQELSIIGQCSKEDVKTVTLSGAKFFSVKVRGVEFLISVDDDDSHYLVRNIDGAVHLSIYDTSMNLSLHTPWQESEGYFLDTGAMDCEFLVTQGRCHTSYETAGYIGTHIETGDILTNLSNYLHREVAARKQRRENNG